jgi:UDP-N-acetylmuramoyl-L-alanyl-D-glutamate--2,6-diaminopimelate ligase
VYNCLAAIAVANSQGIQKEIIARALEKIQPIPGRMEIIRDPKRAIAVLVDYAHDPSALEHVYKTIIETGIKKEDARLIAVLGAVGGGRDRAKRPLLGELAAKFCSYVILTNEDPYDDDPMEIINQIETGVRKDASRVLNQNYWKILNRREAIEKAVSLARLGDIIALTGKGAEEVMAVGGGLVPWDDRAAVREILYKSIA